jgi:hypothetical protein
MITQKRNAQKCKPERVPGVETSNNNNNKQSKESQQKNNIKFYLTLYFEI